MPYSAEKGKKRGDLLPERLTQQDCYRIKKYWRTNLHGDQPRLIVKLGRRQGYDVLGNGAAMNMAKLRLAWNVLVAFMPWYGTTSKTPSLMSAW